MKRYIPMFVLLLLSVLGHVACMMEGASDQDLASEEVELGTDEQALSSQAAPSAARTWKLFTAESCSDICGAPSCSCRSWVPGCPANPQGKACSTLDARCWSVGAGQAKQYVCK